MPKTNKLLIKVPVYISQAIEREKEDFDIFRTTPESLINDAKILIDKYNESQRTIFSEKRTKTTTIGIKRVETSDVNFNKDACLLLKVTSFKSNLLDGFLASENIQQKEIRFKQDDQLCSDTNYFILYPTIFQDIEKNIIQAYWHIFVYDDPSKDNFDMASIARLLMKEIIKVPIHNIKSERLLSELKKYKILSEVHITMSSISDDMNGIPSYMKKYKLSSKLKKEKKISLDNMSSEDAIQAINDESFKNEYNRRQIKFITHNRRIFSMVQEYKEKLLSSIEDSFNFQIEVAEQEVKNGDIFKLDNIKKNIEGVFVNYLSTYSISE